MIVQMILDAKVNTDYKVVYKDEELKEVCHYLDIYCNPFIQIKILGVGQGKQPLQTPNLLTLDF